MAKSGIPEKIKLGDVEYTVKDHPELLEMLQNARKEEKDKLYSQLSTLETKVKTLEDADKSKAGLTKTQEEELKKLKDELAVVKAEKEKLEKAGESDEEAKRKAEEAAKANGEKDQFTKAEMKEMVKEAMAEQKKSFDEELAKVRGEVSTKDVSDYRKEMIAKYDGVLIEKFVPTNLSSKEEVTKAINQALIDSKPYIRKEYEIDGKKQEMSISEFEQHETESKAAAEAAAAAGGQGGTPPYNPQNPPGKPAGGNSDVTGKQLLEKVDSMSDEEYEKNRDAIMKELESVEYGDE